MPTNAVYPDWWGDSSSFAGQLHEGRAQIAGQTQAPIGSRAQPRLAYSIVQEPCPPPPYQDDHVTAQYFQVMIVLARTPAHVTKDIDGACR